MYLRLIIPLLSSLFVFCAQTYKAELNGTLTTTITMTKLSGPGISPNMVNFYSSLCFDANSNVLKPILNFGSGITIDNFTFPLENTTIVPQDTTQLSGTDSMEFWIFVSTDSLQKTLYPFYHAKTIVSEFQLGTVTPDILSVGKDTLNAALKGGNPNITLLFNWNFNNLADVPFDAKDMILSLPFHFSKE